MTAIRTSFLMLCAVLAILPAKSALADLPAAVTPTAAAVTKPAGPCRPGTPGATLNSGDALWTVSPCSGALQAVHLSSPQFHIRARGEPAGLPAWAKSK